ncbi:VWA domain-containing protein [Polaribacter sp. Asnod1-A03]|uniref:VWA domain-containing protein n=1 Tax=Polaribacter sp. Asnod1-A03 TaxID=3160581 RepID=UPI00386CCB13
MINPKIKTINLENSKPILSILVDNSKSIPFFKEENNLNSFVNSINIDKSLQEKFEINTFSFGKTLSQLDSFTFNENETNIFKAITSVNELNKNKIAPIILLSDGNQTIGSDYEFINSKQKIFPIVFGDTIKYKDLKISQLNVNKYSFVKNKFPVEVLLNYEGEESVNSLFSIYKNGKKVFTKNISFSSESSSKTITTNLTSDKKGLQYYTATIQKIADEKNTKNNSKNFSVEVIDQQTKVLILTSVLHPDLGVLKKSIESNKQRSLEVQLIDDFNNQIKDFQLVILNQPNNKFNTVLNQLKSKNSNYFLITGKNTDWSFINNQELGFSKNYINQIEDYQAVYNDSFLPFYQNDINFNQFPPLEDSYGEISIYKEHQVLLLQSINGLQTEQPLLASIEEDNQKVGILFGEGIWKWRSTSFLNSNSFYDFDEFISNLVQYLATNKKRSRLEVNVENLYSANSIINISAIYTDKNYQFDTRADLEITLTNTDTREVVKLPFSLINNSYQVDVENLTSGKYIYRASVKGQNISKTGEFKITDYQIEEQFTNANDKKLKKLANSSGGKQFYKNQFKDLKEELLKNKSFYTTQKSTIKEQNLIDWQWILFIVIGLLTVEWFVRKYYGKT